MLRLDAQDDVLELCQSVQMDPSAYQRFHMPIAPSTSPGGDPRIAGPEAKLQPLAEPKRLATSTEIAPPRSVEQQNDLPETRRLSLAAPGASSLSDRREAANGGPLSPAQFTAGADLSALAKIHARSIAQPVTLPILSGVGGCGATTLVASLGRALSILGERVLLVDGGRPSTLDCYYDSKDHQAGLLLSTGSLSQFEGQIHVVRTHSEALGNSHSHSTRFHRAVAELRGRLDRVLVAGAESLTPTLARQAWSSGMCLVILTPELRSVLSVPSILKTIDEQSKQVGAHVTPWFVLNRFNAAIPAHSVVQSRLADQLGKQLLPFYIPESDLVEEALAQGLSVLDFAPQSTFAEACFDLAEWYRTTSEKYNSLMSPIEETQLVSE